MSKEDRREGLLYSRGTYVAPVTSTNSRVLVSLVTLLTVLWREGEQESSVSQCGGVAG